MGGVGSGVGLPAELIKQIGDLHDEDPDEWTGQEIASTLGVVKSVVSKYLAIKRNDPEKWRRLTLGADAASMAEPDNEELRRAKHHLLHDWEWIAEHVRGLSVQDFHRKGWEIGEKHQESLVMLCRGCGKSEMFAQVRAIQQTLRTAEASLMVMRDEKPPKGWRVNGAGVIISAAEDQAARTVGVVKGFLESEAAQSIWGSFIGRPRWTNNQLYIRQRTRPRSDPTLTALGIGSSKTTGLHPDWIILDDVADYLNSWTHGSRLKVRGWLANTLRGIAQPHTKIWWMNTPYHPEDIIESQRSRGIKVFCMPAIIRDKRTGEEVSFWPEFFPLESGKREFDGERVIGLKDKRAEMDHDSPGSFDAQYQMDTSTIAERRIDLGMARTIRREDLPVDLLVEQFADLAWAKDPGARTDWTAMATVGYQRSTKNWYLIRVRRAKMKPVLIRSLIQSEYDEYKGVWVGAERTGLYAKEVKQLMASLAGIPWKPVTPKGSKETRALDLQDILETGKFYVIKGEPWYDGFEAECRLFPAKGVPDDQIDAVCQAIIQIKGSTGQTTGFQMSSFTNQFKG